MTQIISLVTGGSSGGSGGSSVAYDDTVVKQRITTVENELAVDNQKSIDDDILINTRITDATTDFNQCKTDADTKDTVLQAQIDAMRAASVDKLDEPEVAVITQTGNTDINFVEGMPIDLGIDLTKIDYLVLSLQDDNQHYVKMERIKISSMYSNFVHMWSYSNKFVKFSILDAAAGLVHCITENRPTVIRQCWGETIMKVDSIGANTTGTIRSLHRRLILKKDINTIVDSKDLFDCESIELNVLRKDSFQGIAMLNVADIKKEPNGSVIFWDIGGSSYLGFEFTSGKIELTASSRAAVSSYRSIAGYNMVQANSRTAITDAIFYNKAFDLPCSVGTAIDLGFDLSTVDRLNVTFTDRDGDKTMMPSYRLDLLEATDGTVLRCRNYKSKDTIIVIKDLKKGLLEIGKADRNVRLAHIEASLTINPFYYQFKELISQLSSRVVALESKI
jgi:hypothetical protein